MYSRNSLNTSWIEGACHRKRPAVHCTSSTAHLPNASFRASTVAGALTVLTGTLASKARAPTIRPFVETILAPNSTSAVGMVDTDNWNLRKLMKS
jgi:hypothetical protein